MAARRLNGRSKEISFELNENLATLVITPTNSHAIGPLKLCFGENSGQSSHSIGILRVELIEKKLNEINPNELKISKNPSKKI